MFSVPTCISLVVIVVALFVMAGVLVVVVLVMPPTTKTMLLAVAIGTSRMHRQERHFGKYRCCTPVSVKCSPLQAPALLARWDFGQIPG